ncbi:2179_t:CDS:2, partial [Entrophospora sp. SA101]
ATLVEQYLSVESLYFEIPSTAINYKETIYVKYMGKEAKEKIEQTLDYEQTNELNENLSGCEKIQLHEISRYRNIDQPNNNIH